MRGYDREEVDAFLRAVADDYGRLAAQLDETREQVEALRDVAAGGFGAQALWLTALLTAADHEARRVTREAERRATHLLELARRSSDATISRAHWVRNQLLAAAADGRPADAHVEETVSAVIRSLRSRRERDYRRALDTLSELRRSLVRQRADLDALDAGEALDVAGAGYPAGDGVDGQAPGHQMPADEVTDERVSEG